VLIDSHVYCFQPIDSPAGFPTTADHLAIAQWGHANHHQPAWRIRDRAPADARAQLLDSSAPGPYHLADVNFRCDHAKGRVVWTVNGEDYTKQFFPPNLRNVEFTADSLIAEMDYAGVDLALIHVDPMLGRNVPFLAEAVRRYPDRLRSMIPVAEWRIGPDTDAVIAETVAAVREHGLHAIKFIPALAYYLRDDAPWDDGVYRPFWEAVSELGVPVFFTLGPRPGFADPRAGYLAEQRILLRWLERYPKVRCSLTHGFNWRHWLDDGTVRLPEEIWEPFKDGRCGLELCIPVRVGDVFDYPYRAFHPVIETLVERVGARQLLWGTDMPFQNRFCTYRQSIDYITRYCDFLSADDRAWIFGGTAARILGLEA
jgi:predicted TIM-barrel fold metal-dependent hydrolase